MNYWEKTKWNQKINEKKKACLNDNFLQNTTDCLGIQSVYKNRDRNIFHISIK